MTVKQAAKRLEISERLCYQLVAEGQIRCLRIGQLGRRGKIIIRESDIATFIKKVEINAS